MTPSKINFGIPLITAKNVKKGFIDYTISEFISQESYNGRKSRGIPKKGDLLFSTEAPLGNVAIADKDVFSVGQRLITLQQYNNSNILDNQFFMYVLLESEFQSELFRQKTGTTVSGIKAAKLKEIYIPLPPLEEQKRIVEKVRHLLRLVDTIEQNKLELENLKELAKSKVLDLAIQGKLVEQDPNDEPASVLLEHIRAEKEQMVRDGKLKKKEIMNDSIIYKGDDNCYYEKCLYNDKISLVENFSFNLPNSWELTKFQCVCTVARGGSPRPIKSYLTNNSNGVNWIKIGDTEKGEKYIYQTKEKIIPEGVTKSRYVKEGDFLLTNSMSFGRPYILKTDGCIHDGWLVIGDVEKCFYQDFLYYMLSSSTMYNLFKHKASGSTVENLNSDLVRDTIVIVPPYNEQIRIAKYISLCIKIIEKMKKNLI